MENKWVHIIGIAGITSSALAVMMKDLGWKVTGSDEDIFSPAKDVLDDAKVNYSVGFSYKNLIDGDKMPDLVILAGSKNAKNKELLFAQKQGLTVKGYPEVLADLVVVKDNSIVVTGTYGKTSITAMLVYVFEYLGKKVSYMYGGKTDSLSKTIAPKFEDTDFSIVEGDEYIASKVDLQSKFFYYKPKYLIINSIAWDHTDFFKTEEDYINNFKDLVSRLPEDGVIFHNNSENISKAVENSKSKLIGFDFDKYKVETNLVGRFNHENAAFVNMVVSHFYPDQKDKIQQALKSFKGMKRRLELRYSKDNIKVIDDFGSSPAKAKGTMNTVNQEFDDYKKIVIYEPNEGGRTEESRPIYKGAFDGVDTIILPGFRNIPNRLSSEDLYDILSKEYKTILSKNSEEVLTLIKNEIDPDRKNVIIFMGSHNFEDQIKKLLENI